jgi:hypothetical protein
MYNSIERKYRKEKLASKKMGILTHNSATSAQNIIVRFLFKKIAHFLPRESKLKKIHGDHIGTGFSGPYGIRLLNETLMWHVGSQVQELKKLVLQNKDALIALRTNFDKPDVMKELAKRLVQVDSVLQVGN